jgi:hypothetical protein
LLGRHVALDLRPDRTLFLPIAPPPQPGDFQVGDA